MSKNINLKPTGFVQSCKGACRGIAYSLQTEKHLRFHFFVAFIVTTLGLYVNLAREDWLFVIYAIGSVIVAELFNTALERNIDLTQPTYHPIAGIAKDVASGAVLITAIQAVIIGIIVFSPYLGFE
ncbi:MAG: diacylglycerol kinase [Gracilibacter sp. BRH_c7a]|nr:MAG: diacylglycerol kinase [Gracilibacter sp. BRH_c7a]